MLVLIFSVPSRIFDGIFKQQTDISIPVAIISTSVADVL